MNRKVKYSLRAPLEYSNREHAELLSPGPYRSQFQRDRDRILYSKQFRRLSGKTQVFLTASHDHIRTRLTHTLEVAQIATVTARYLKLDENLAEAIALGHDAGHTPFGHTGENALSLIMSGCDELAPFQQTMTEPDKGFKHNLQSLRVLCDLEVLRDKHSGLNLTDYTLWGIKNHTNSKWKPCKHIQEEDNSCYLKKHKPKKECNQGKIQSVGFYDKYERYVRKERSGFDAWSFEGYLVKFADEIAQRHHDIEDALFMGTIREKELIEEIETLVSDHMDMGDKKLLSSLKEKSGDKLLFLPKVSTLIVGFLNKQLIQNSISNLNKFIDEHRIRKRKDFVEIYPELEPDQVSHIIGFPESLVEKENQFHSFLKSRILNSFEVQRMDGKGRFIIRRLFKAYLKNPRQLHDSTINFIFRIHDPSHKSWPTAGPSEMGKMREEIDSLQRRADMEFQVSLLRGICDHVAGMTDMFALSEYERLYGGPIIST